MEELSLLPTYHAELKNVALEIAISTILGNQFGQTKVLLSLAEKFDLLNATEKRRLKNFLFVRKYKLYKIKRINTYFLNKVALSIVHFQGTLGKIKWIPSQVPENSFS